MVGLAGEDFGAVIADDLLDCSAEVADIMIPLRLLVIFLLEILGIRDLECECLGRDSIC